MENKDDLKKLYDSNEYLTKIIGINTGVESSEDETEEKISAIISLLTDPENKELKEQTLLVLKKSNAGDLLLSSISNQAVKNKKHILIAACWESEINFSSKLPFFINLVNASDYLVTLEAITVIEHMEGPFSKTDLEKGIKKLKTEQKTAPSEKALLLKDLIIKLESITVK